MKTRFCWGNHCSQSPASPWYKKLGTELQDSGGNLRTQVKRDHVVQYFGKCPVNWCWVPADACLLTISYPHPLHCLFWRYWRSFHWKDTFNFYRCAFQIMRKITISIVFWSTTKIMFSTSNYISLYKVWKCNYKYVHQSQLWNNIQMNEKFRTPMSK